MLSSSYRMSLNDTPESERMFDVCLLVFAGEPSRSAKFKQLDRGRCAGLAFSVSSPWSCQTLMDEEKKK